MLWPLSVVSHAISGAIAWAGFSTPKSASLRRRRSRAVQASKLPVDSRYARIMQVMQAAERDRPRMRRIADRLSAWYTPLALGIAARWSADGIDLPLTVNLCARCTLDSKLPPMVADRLAAHGVAPQRLVLEITEQIMVADPERVSEATGRPLEAEPGACVHGCQAKGRTFSEGFAVYVVAIVGVAAGITWVVVRLTPSRKPSGPAKS